MSPETGFLTSEQYTNWEWGDGFRSNASIKAENTEFSKLDAMRQGEIPPLNPEGHSIFEVRGRELASNDSNLGKLTTGIVGKRHYFGELNVGNFTELQTYTDMSGVARNTFFAGGIFKMSPATQAALRSNDALISRTVVHGSELGAAARTWQMRHQGGRYSIGPCDCRGYVNYLRARSAVDN